MTKLLKQRFTYGTNSEIPSLWASMGYIYGHCARQLHYTDQSGYNGFTQKDLDMMETGKETHDTVERWFKNTYPDLALESEVKKSFMAELPDGTPFLIGAKADLIAHMHPNLRSRFPPSLIEIKFLYGRSAYYQTLLEKLVFWQTYSRDIQVKCFQYANLSKPQFAKQLLIPLKADIDMAVVYAGRVMASLYHRPPRFPGAAYSHPRCRGCMHRETCYREPLESYETKGSPSKEAEDWETFKRQSQPFIEKIRQSTNTTK